MGRKGQIVYYKGWLTLTVQHIVHVQIPVEVVEISVHIVHISIKVVQISIEVVHVSVEIVHVVPVVVVVPIVVPVEIGPVKAHVAIQPNHEAVHVAAVKTIHIEPIAVVQGIDS